MSSSLGRGNLLLCEDNQSMREFWSMYFREEGWNVTACPAPEKAFEILKNKDTEFHLGYFDVQYDGSSFCGFDIGRCVAESSNPFPFYIMSMTYTAQKENESRKVGALGFVEKSFDNILRSYRLAMTTNTPMQEVSVSRDSASPLC